MSTDLVIYPRRTKDHSGNIITVVNPANYILGVVALVAIECALYTLHELNEAWASKDASSLWLLLPYWVIGPPLWFWCDYFLVFRNFGDPAAFDSFKHAQHVSLAIWASIGLLLGAVITSDHFKEPSNTCNRTGSVAQVTSEA